MIRQYGVVLLFTYLIVYVFSFSKKPTKKEIIALVVPFIALSLLGIFWPRFKAISEPKSMDLSLFFTSFRSFFSRIFDVEILPYIGFILLPFSSELFVKIKNMAKVGLVMFSLPLSYVFYQNNIFNLGNLFYLESLYARHAINIRKHLFNNIPFKIALSYILALSVLVLAYILFRSIYTAYRSKSIRLSVLKKNPILLSFILIISGFYFIVMLTDRVFDRYLMNFFLFLTLLTTFLYSKYKYKVTLLFYVTLTFTSAMTFLLTMDYYRQNQLKWELADKVTNLKGIDRGEVFVDQEYAYTVFMEESDNFRGLEKVSYGGYVRTCFVQEYSKSFENKLNNLIGNIENRSVIHKYFPNIYIDKAGLMKSESNEFDSGDVLYFEQEYISPIYNLLGKHLFVRAFCLN